MKRCAPWLIVVVAVWAVLISLRPAKEYTFQFTDFGKLPALLNGRIQPLDSVARNSLLQMRSKQSVALGKGEELTAIQWLIEVMAKPEVADTRKVFRIDHPELLALLKLPVTEKHFSFKEIEPSLDEVEKQARR